MDRFVRVLNQEEAEQARAKASDEFAASLRALIIQELKRGVHTLHINRLEYELRLARGGSVTWK